MKAKVKKPAGAENASGKTKGNWSQAIREALKKKSPDGGWPAPDGRYGNKKKPG